MTNDIGLAPNPFWNWCTLAVCTPNHMNAKLKKDDWIIGHSTKNTDNKLIYAMKVIERIGFNEYFYDKRFEKKKPKVGNYMHRVGDNIYYKNSNGKWEWIRYSLHSDKRKIDTDHPIVFISNYYYYFGSNADPNFPIIFPKLIKNEQGICYVRDHLEIIRFVEWLKGKYKLGRNNNIPRDVNNIPSC